MQDAARVLAGDCTVEFEGDDSREVRGEVVVLVKPDDTVLVHDAVGYRPAAWLTRADTVRFARDADGFRLVASDGDRTLRVTSERADGTAHYPVSPSGPPVGACPDCDGALVRTADGVVCIGCRTEYALPRDATVVDDACPACGLPRIAVERGDRFEVCLDRGCDPLVDRVAARFGGEWDCPDCGTALAVRQERGLRAVCPDCDRRLALRPGVVTGDCDCGLPEFDGRCLDPDCTAAP